MALLGGHNLIRRWPTLLLFGIIGFLAVEAVGLPKQLPHIAHLSSSSNHTTAASTTQSTTTRSTTQAVVASTATTHAPPIATVGPVAIHVMSFDAGNDGSAGMTLEISSSGNSSTAFQPDQLELRTADGKHQVFMPHNLPSDTIPITKNLPLITPVIFPAATHSANDFQLLYKGIVIYTGRPG